MGSLNRLLLLALFCLSLHGFSTASSCSSDEDVLDQNSLSIRTMLDQRGEWQTIVSNNLDPSFSPNNSNIDVKRQLVEKDGKKELVVSVSLKGNVNQLNRVPLRFHTSGARNVFVYNNGRSAKRIDELKNRGFGGIITNRALQDDELFQVKLDKVINKYVASIGIGIIRQNPDDAEYNEWMKCGTTILYNTQLYDNGSVIKKKYGSNLRKLRAGDRVGVMKKKNGNLHFFVNDVDLGVAESGIKKRVYGVLDLYGNAVEASLV